MEYFSIYKCKRRHAYNITTLLDYGSVKKTESEKNRWLIENKTMLLKFAREVKKELKRVKSLPADEKAENAQIFAACAMILEKFSFDIDENKLIDELALYQTSRTYFTITELSLLKTSMMLYLFEVIGENIRANSDAERIENAVKCIYRLADIDFEHVYAMTSYTESFLIRDPADVYKDCDAETKRMYRRKLSENARKKNVEEYKLAEEYYAASLKGEGKRSHIGYYIMEDSKVKCGELYFIGLSILPLIFVLPLFVVSIIEKNYLLLFGALLLVPVLRKSIKVVIEDLIKRSSCADILPRIDLFGKRIPEFGKTLAVFTVVLTNEEKDKDLFRKLSTYARAYNDNNLTFAILADLPDAAERVTENDDKIINFAKSRINSIKESGARALLFCRNRSYSRSEEKYIGKERKRGAQNELIAFLRGEENELAAYGADDFSSYKYILALDYDTEILDADLKKLIGTAIHPLNQPEFITHNGYEIVSDGYGVIQPSVEISLENADRFNRFTVLRNVFEGRSAYETANYSVYSKLFNIGTYCGKGLIDIDAYYRVLCNCFPEEKILSHDTPEGVFLRCGFASDVKVYDSPVQSYKSERKRSHRWMRGDTQSLILSGKNIENTPGTKRKSPLSYVDRMILKENVYDVLIQILRLPLVILSCLLGRSVGKIILLLSFFDLLISLVKGVVASVNIPRRKYLSGMPDYYQTIAFFIIFEISTMADRFVNAADAFVRSIYRLFVSKKRLLEWTVSSMTENDHSSDLKAYYSTYKSSVVIGALSIMFSIFTDNLFSAISLIALGIIWVLFPLFLNQYEKSVILSEDERTQSDKEELRRHAEKMWRYFEKYVSDEDNHLPPDNVSELPEKRIAPRTSPTNIGMYLLSLVNAFDFGFIGSDELFFRLDKTLSTVNDLEKWHGHLYNWYDIKNKKVLFPAYISTVDSGNFTASLTVVKAAISGLGPLFERLVNEIETLIKDVDFKSLYNQKRNLFYIGYNDTTKEYDRNVYDLYMSEMLTTSFYTVAMGEVSASHISSLGRLYNDKKDLSPMLSWSGSAFEYFMPSIFLPRVDRTDRGEALLCAYKCQKYKSRKLKELKIFGVSESGYYDFDDSMSYSYKAHGTEPLALSPDSHKDTVFSPYSLYLMLGYGYEVIDVLKALYKTELKGKYGLYESFDLTKSRVGNGYGIVRQYMSHHIGMSIASIANYCLDNINVKRFCEEPKVKASLPILYTKIELCREYNNKNTYKIYNNPVLVENSEGIIKKHGTALLTNGKTRIVANDKGNVTIFNGKDMVTQTFENGQNAFRVLIKADGEVYDCINGDSVREGVKSSFFFNGNVIKYKNEMLHNGSILKTELSLTVDSSATDVYARLAVDGDVNDLKILFFILPVVNDEAAYLSSPSYSDLFVVSERTADGALVFKRRTLGEETKLMKIFYGGELLKVFTKADKILPCMYQSSDIIKLFDAVQEEKTNGACVHPLCAFVAASENEKNDCFDIRISLDESENTSNSFEKAEENARKHFMLMSSLAGADEETVKTAYEIFGRISERNNKITEMKVSDTLFYRRDILWRHGISGDLPLALIFVGDSKLSTTEYAIRQIIKAKRFLFVCGVRFDLVFVTDHEGYNDEGINLIRSSAEKSGCGALINKNNGIFILGFSKLSENDRRVFIALSDYVKTISFDKEVDYSKKTEEFRFAIAKNTAAEQNSFEIKDSEVTIENGKSSFPWCMIYANHIFGTLLTNRSAGFSWYKNSALGTVTKRHTDPIKGNPGEILELSVDGVSYDLLGSAALVSFDNGCAVYKGSIENIEYSVSVGVDKKLPVKLYHLSLSDNCKNRIVRANLVIYPTSKSVVSKNAIKPLSEENITIKIFSVSSEIYEDTEAYADAISVKSDITNGKCAFVLSVYPTLRSRDIESYIKNKFRSPELILHAFSEYEKQKSSMLETSAYRGKYDWLEKQLSMSAYQAVYWRMLARCGYSQTGGAYGFRDQLQDSLAALYFDPDMTKIQILRSSLHQYENGRVQHWWHPGVGGLKSRCSDDFMWLPYVTAEYILATGDFSILDLHVSYLTSLPLADNEEDRYEKAQTKKERFTVLDHLKRAIEASLERGAHGLPLMLSGDWNDGMSDVGKDGRGESVWLAFFFTVTYRKLAEALLLEDKHEDFAKKLLMLADETLYAAEFAWDGGWYLRAYDDDGEPLGSKNCIECKIDIIPQAFSVFAKAKSERSRIAMKNAEVMLYNRKYGIFRLFAPSFENVKKYGYICKYPAGVRENGGQYTHAAIWAAMAYFEIGEHELGLEVLRSLSPVNIYQRGRMNGRFNSEPYLLAADIYYGDGITGKSGWSGYTGSAAWYYRTVMKYVLGVEPVFGKFKVTPKAYNSENYTVSLMYKRSRITIDFVFDEVRHDENEYDYVYYTGYEKSIFITPEDADLKILIKVTN